MRVRLLLVGVLGALCAVLALGAGSALAGYTYPLEGELVPAGGSFGTLEAGSVAIDDANGDTYVAASSSGVVDVFETATGTELAALDGSLTPAGSFGGGQVQVAANNASGDVYVLDSTDNVLDVFNGLGGYVCQITGASTPSASECNGVAGSDTPAHGFSDPGGVTVDQATGDVYVVDAHHGVVDVFSSAGAYVRQLSLASIPGGFSELSETYTRGVAVDDFNGDVFVADSGRDVVYEFNAAGGNLATWTGANTPVGSFGGSYVSVAADDVSGNVYVTDSGHQVTDVFEASGAYSARFSSGTRSLGTAVDQGNGRIYVSDSGSGTVDIFARVLLPDVATGPVSGLGVKSVTLNGTVNPDGVPVTTCVFEYGNEASYGQSVPCAVSPGSGTAPVAVSADLAGLEEGATYHYRLVAANASGENRGADEIVTMPSLPSIDGASAVNVGPSSVDLSASINPHGALTAYRLEYGTSAAYGTSIPVPDRQISSGLLDRAVSQHVTGLQQGTTYHWRVVAQNIAGSVTGGDHTFIYNTGGAGLPDGRAYEMVTPPHKGGALIGDVLLGLPPDIGEDGSHLILSTVQCFGDATSCPANDGTVGTPYAFTRTSGGWSASALAPPASQFAVNNAWLVSADAGTGLFMMPTPPVGEDDWYARDVDGSVRDIGPVPPAGELGQPQSGGGFTQLETTADFSHLVYHDSEFYWPFDATKRGRPSLYEYVGVGNRAPVLVGVSGGRGSTDLISVCGTALGDYGREPYDGLSEDGRTVFLTALACASGSGVNAGVAVPTNELFARIDESRTVPISTRSPLECTSGSGCLGSPPGDAGFAGASVDGSKAFFLDTQQLTDNASEDGQEGDNAYADDCSRTVGVNGCNLYEYDFANPAGRNLLAASAGDSSGGGPRVQGVVSIAPDGSHIYFVAKGVLTGVANDQGATAGDGMDNLYVFERDAAHPTGRVAFIASLSPADHEQWTPVFVSDDVTPDGRFLVFTSHGALTVDASSSTGAAQVFRYDAQTGRLVRVSIGEGGFNDNGNAGIGNASIVAPMVIHAGPARTDPTMSSDGSYVFFESPVALTPGALDDVPLGGTEVSPGEPAYAYNVYEYHEGHVYLLSDGRDVSRSVSAPCEFHESSVCLLGTDATGSNVFFTTADPMLPEDGDTALDVYDARVCTASEPCIKPALSPPVPCEGDACHGAPAGTPPVTGAGTVAFSGPGNLASSVKSVVKATQRAHGKAKKHTQRAHGKPKVRKKARKPRPKRHAGRSSRRHGHTSRTGGK